MTNKGTRHYVEVLVLLVAVQPEGNFERKWRASTGRTRSLKENYRPRKLMREKTTLTSTILKA
jgi:hypothetical protein